MKSIVKIAAVCLLLAGSVFGQAKIQEGGTLFESGQVQFQPPAGTSPPAFAITTLTLPADTAGVAYPATTVQTANGTAPITCTTASILPTGLSLASNCTFSGTPTTVGNYPVVVVANDNAAHTAQKTFNIAISCPTLQILSPPTLPIGDVGFAYNFTVQTAGGISPYTFTMPGLPTGETINSTTGVISGTPSVPGSFTPVLTLTDSCPTQSQIVTQNFTEQVNTGLSITTATLPNGQVGQPLSAQLNVAGGTPPYQWSVPAGPIPAGAEDILDYALMPPGVRSAFHLTGTAAKYFRLDAGLIWWLKGASGGPWDGEVLGADYVKQWITEGPTFNNLSGFKMYRTPVSLWKRYHVPGADDIVYTPGPNIYDTTESCGSDNLPGIDNLGVRGELTGPFTDVLWTTTFGGDIPDHTPYLLAQKWIKCTSNSIAACTTEEDYWLVKGWGQVRWVPKSCSAGVCTPTSSGSINTNEVAGGAPTPNFACKLPNVPVQGMLPRGVLSTASPELDLAANTGAESGTPNKDGAYTFTVQVEDATGKFAQHTYTQTIGCPALAISTQSLPNGTQNQLYSFQEVATGGFGTLTWTGSSFPSGIGVSLTGSVSGTTANFGSFTPRIVVTDSCSTPQSVSIQPTLSIAQQIGTLTIQTPTTLPQAVEGQPFQLQMSASGGLTPYLWALVSGSFPPGLSFTGSTNSGSCHVVLPGGSGTHSGVDWNNALIGLPGTLVRGDSYYLGDGSYSGYNFTTTGTTPIAIKKATASDHCTATGWNPATMGSSQAVFSGTPTAWNSTSASAGNYTIDGQTGTGETGSSYGIKFLNAGTCSTLGGCGGKTFVLDNQVPNVTLAHAEMQGGGLGAGNDATEHLIWMQGTGALLDHIFAHDTECDFMQGYGPGNFTVQNSFFFRNGNGGGSPHCQLMWANGMSNLTWRYNSVHDVGGSAIWTFATGTCLAPSTCNDNINIYGNYIWLSNPPASGTNFAGLGDGVFACINTGVVCTNVHFYNNTVALMKQYNGQAMNTGNFLENAGGSFTGENNIYFGNNGNSGTYAFTPTVDHNSYLGTGGTDTRCTTACVTNAAASDPFVASSTGNFQLSGETSNVNNWFPLASPFNVDALGNVRTSDRGAFQFNGSPASIPIPNGTISGTPTSAGTFTPTISVTDAQPVTISHVFSLTVVCPPFSVPIANPMPAAQQGVLYSGYQVPTSGGIAPFIFGASGLPTGLGINASTGAITGTPSVNGPFSPSVTVTDSCQPVGTPVTANTTLQVNTPTLAIVTSSLTPGQINQPYSQTLSGQGGTPPYSWSIISGTLQTGLSLVGANIQGAPSVASTVSLTIQLADSAAHIVTGNFSLTINPAQTGDNADCSTTNQWIGPASDGPAGAPQACFNTARASTPSNGATVNVTSGSCASLQAAVNAAAAGQTIITPVATYANCQITPKTAGTATAWITLKTAAFASLPPEGTNVTPAWAGVTALTGRPAYAQPAVAGTYLPKISSNTASGPTISFLSTAAFWRVEGFNIVSAASADGFSVVQAQTGANHIILDQVWINGADANQSKNSVQGGFRINGSAQFVALVDSVVTNIGCINGGTCGDAQGVFLGGSSAGIDGPLKVVNNFIEAAGENIFSGGGGVGTTTSPATDVEIRHNHFFKPLYLKSNDPNYIGVNFNIKNCMEFKNAQRVWAEGNVFEGDWAGQSDQHGVCILLDSRNQNFSYSGTASASGNTLTWVSGSQFQSNIVSPSCAPGGCRVTFNGTACVGTGFISATQIAVSCGSGSGSIANNWQQVSTPTGATHIRDFAINPTNNHWYIIDRVSGAWVSTNQGTSWTQINTGISPITGWTITYDVTDSQIVAGFINGASSAKFFRSSNDGATWTAMPYTGSTVNFPAYTGTARSPGALIFGGGNSGSAGTCATFFSTNAGASSTVASCPANQTAPPSGGAYAYLYNPIDGALWMGDEQNGGYCSTNNGASWIPGTPPDQNFGGPMLGNLQGLTYDNAGVMVFSAQGGIYKANSAGCSLHTLTNVKPTGGAPNGRNLGRDTNGNLYWGHSGVTTDLHAVYQSTDGGVTWHVFDTGLPTNATGGKSFEAWQFHQNPADCQMYINLQDGAGTSNAGTLWRTVGTCTGGLPPQVANASFTAATPGLNPSAVLTDVVVKNNIIKHAANGLQIANPPSDNGDLSLTNARIAVDNNLFDDINGQTYVTNGDCCNYGAVFQIQNQEAGAAQLDQIYVVHNTGLSIFPPAHSSSMGFGTAISGTSIGHMTFLNNLGTGGWWSGSANPCNTGTTAEAYLVCWTPPAQLCWSNNLLAIATFTGAGTTQNNPPYPTVADNGNCPVGASKTNTTIANFAAFNFTTLNNANGGNYLLQGSSPGHNAASDGTDIGVNWPQLQNAIAGVP